MSNRFRINSLVVLLLAVLFYWFFMTAKHDAALAKVNPFAEDPYDAVGSFGIQAALFLSLVAMVRAFRSYGSGTVSNNQSLLSKASLLSQASLLARTQMLAVLAVGVTLAGNIVAMLRYPSLWLGSSDGYKLAGLVGGLAFLTLAAGVLIRRSLRETTSETLPNLRRRAVAISFASLLILALYPENWRLSTPGALLTVVVGAILLFAPMWAWGTLLVPWRSDVNVIDSRRLFDWLRRYRVVLGLILGLGMLLGGLLVLAEFLFDTGGGGTNLGQMAFVASVYIGLETAGIAIGYLFLSKPSGLDQPLEFLRSSVG